MPGITSAIITTLVDPTLRDIGQTVLRTARLAAEKAVAHHAQPETYPISTSDTGSLEYIFLSRFRELSADKQQYATAKLMPFLSDSPRRLDVYRDLSVINIKSADSVEKQMLATAIPASLRIDPHSAFAPDAVSVKILEQPAWCRASRLGARPFWAPHPSLR